MELYHITIEPDLVKCYVVEIGMAQAIERAFTRLCPMDDSLITKVTAIVLEDENLLIPSAIRSANSESLEA